jgi:hypothetical protein
MTVNKCRATSQREARIRIIASSGVPVEPTKSTGGTMKLDRSEQTESRQANAELAEEGL